MFVCRRSSSPSGDGDTSQVKNPPAKLSETQKSEALDENLVDDGNEEQEFQIVELDTINATSNQLSNTSNNVHSGSTVLSRKSPSKRVRGKVDPAIKSNRRSRLLNIKFKLPKSNSTDKQLTKSVSNEVFLNQIFIFFLLQGNKLFFLDLKLASN